MNLSLLIASRGCPTELLRVITEIDKRVSDPDRVTISIALDDDDESVPQPPPLEEQTERLLLPLA